MKGNVNSDITKMIRCMCLIITAILATTTISFAGEVEHGLGTAPKAAFALNSSELLLLDEDPETSPTLLQNITPAINIAGNTYIPIRDFSDALGYGVEYNAAQKSLIVSNNEKSLELFLIKTFADLSNENAYVTIDGTGYTKVRDFAKLDDLQIRWQDNVILLYKLLSPSEEISDAVSTKAGIGVPTSTEGAIEVSIETGYPRNWSEAYTSSGDQIILTNELIQSLKKNSVVSKNNYDIAVKTAYDGKYYKPFINPYVPYSYTQMLADIEKLKSQYPEYITTASAGKSVEGRDLITIEFGKGPKHIYIFGSHHAREYISTTYIMYFINQTSYAAKTGINNTNFDVNNILSKVTYHIIPMVNPDGVNLVQNGIDSVSPAFREQLKAMPFMGTQYGYQGWKSNINGVDLNRNYPIFWERTKTKHNNASTFYQGPYAASEPEVQAVMNYLNLYQPEAVISVHTQGKVLYWSNPEERINDMTRRMVQSSGFRSIQERIKDSSGGFLSNYARDVRNAHEMTIELCEYIGPYPYPDSQFDAVWNPAKELLLIVGDEVAKK